MLRIFTSVHPLALVGLLLFTILLRLPSFQANYFATDEAIYLTAAQRIIDGFTLYTDIWEHKPPIIYWLYATFVYIFGEYALTAIRVFSCIYVYLTALSIAHLLYDYRLTPRYSVWAAFLYIFVTATPWYAQELNAELLINLPAFWAVILLIEYVIDERKDYDKLFWAGILCGLCFMIKIQGLLSFAVIIIGYYLIARFVFAELIILISSFALAVGLNLFYLYWNGALTHFIDHVWYYNLDYFGGAYHPHEDKSWSGILEYLKFWLSPIILALGGYWLFNGRGIKLTTKQRKIEMLFFIWGIISLITIFLGGKRFYLHYFYLVLPAIIFYSSIYLNYSNLTWWLRLNQILTGAFPIVVFSIYFVVRSDYLYFSLNQYFKPDGWVVNLRHRLQPDTQLIDIKKFITLRKPDATIWVAAYQPEIYLKLNQKCGTKYLNFTMAYHKMNWLSHNARKADGFSAIETQEAVYKTFSVEKPDVIIDIHHVFAEIKDKIPLLLEEYTLETIHNYPVFYRKPKRMDN